MPSHFEIKKTRNGQFMFNLMAKNGEIILTSELYRTKASSKKGIKSIRINALVSDRFIQRMTTTEKPYFVLKARNGEIIGRSEVYSSIQAMKTGIASVRKNAPQALIIDKAISNNKFKIKDMVDSETQIWTKSTDSNPLKITEQGITFGDSEKKIPLKAQMDFKIQIEIKKGSLRRGSTDVYLIRISPWGTITTGPENMQLDDDNHRGWFRREIVVEFGAVGPAWNKVGIVEYAPHPQNNVDEYYVRTQSTIDFGLSKDGPTGGFTSGAETTRKLVTSDFDAEALADIVDRQIVSWSFQLNHVIDQWSSGKDSMKLSKTWNGADSGIRNWMYEPMHRGGLYEIPALAYHATTFQSSDFLSCEAVFQMPIPLEEESYSVPIFFGCAQNLWALMTGTTQFTRAGASTILCQGGIITINVANDGITFGDQQHTHSQSVIKISQWDAKQALDVPQDKEALKMLDEMREKFGYA